MVGSNNASFDDLAKDYDKYRTGYSTELFDELVNFGLSPGKSVLDIGCGNGIASVALAARGCVLTGVDPSEPMLVNARLRVPEGKFVVGSAENLPFADRTFDHAICAQAFHWFDQPRAFEETIRVVKPGGVVPVWWKVLTHDAAIRVIRDAACTDADLAPPKDVFGGAFKAFYAAPFSERSLRVMPFIWRTTVKTWVGYERSRAKARNAFASKREAYLKALEKRLVREAGGPDAAMIAPYMQYVYIGYV